MPMDVREVQAILQAEKSDALGAVEASTLSDERSKAMEYYLGSEDLDGDMTPPKDRSRAVSTDVADTIEGLLPSLMEIFASGDDVIEFEPVGVEDEEAAQQETDYINHVFWHRNHGFVTLYSLFKDALLQKVGIVKCWWEETEEEDRETYLDLDDDAYGILALSPEIEIVEHTERVEPIPGASAIGEQLMASTAMTPPVPQTITLHDVTVMQRKTYGRAKVEPVPPEEFGISRRARSIHVGDSDYCYHETRRTESELTAEGYERAQIQALPTAGASDSEEDIARDTVDESEDLATASVNKATRLIRVTEHYVRMDYRGDGKSALYKVMTAGGTGEVLRKKGKPDIVEVDYMPFAALTPIIMPHRFFGRSVADLVMDIQRIKTALIRSLLDNIYLANNQRVEIAASHAGDRTLDDLLTNRPGGVVRTERPGGLLPIPNQSIGSFAYPMLEYQDAVREWRTGVTRQGQGIDAKSLADQSATAAAQMFTMAQARMRLIARIFAETGIRDLFRLMHATTRKHGRSQQDTVRLRNKWVQVDPRDWKTRNDMTVNVGIASGSKDQQMAFLMNLLGIQREAVQQPQIGLTGPGNIYNTLKRIIALANLKGIEPYFTDPDEKDEQGNFVNRAESGPDPKQAEMQAKMQMEQARLEIDKQKAIASHQLDQQKFQMQAQADAQKAAGQREAEAMKAQADQQSARYRADQEMALRREIAMQEIALKRESMAAELQLKRELAMMQAAAGQAPDQSTDIGDVTLGGEPG